MSKLVNHGLLINDLNHGTLKFGLVELISSRQSFLWSDFPNITSEQRELIKRFEKLSYWQCAKKCNDTAHKLNQALYKLGNCLLIAENEDAYAYDGAPLEKASVYFEAMNDIPYHLDAFISYLKILADCIAFAIPFFYQTSKSIANNGFRGQKKWFSVYPNFDPEYTKILNEQTRWFDLLAGKGTNGNSEKGIRDVNFHNFGTYQIGQSVFQDGRHEIFVSQITSKGIIHNDVLSTLEELVEDFFYYLDRVYELFTQRFCKEIPQYDWLSPSKSVMMNIEMSNVQQKYRLYPIIKP
jgi:hypothetical protein